MILFESIYIFIYCIQLLATFVYAGGWIGNVLCLWSTGQLSASQFGWPSCFYVWGCISITSSILFYFIGKESPAEHPSISQDEKEYIESSLGIIETEEVRIYSIKYLHILNIETKYRN